MVFFRFTPLALLALRALLADAQLQVLTDLECQLTAKLTDTNRY